MIPSPSANHDVAKPHELGASYHRLREEIDDLALEVRVEDADEIDPELAARIKDLSRKIDEIRNAYFEDLPSIPLSRCPFSGDIVVHSLENRRLDAPWWNFEAPLRPEEDLPETFHCLTGAVQLGTDVNDAPSLCCPGPGVPFVVPRILIHPEVKAVVSMTAVGRHRAYVICYFHEPEVIIFDLVPPWGAPDCVHRTPAGLSLISSAPLHREELSFDIEYWIQEGKLLWIAPGDETLTLHADRVRCPFLNLEGRRFPQAVQDGLVWNASE